jgi:ATP-dependent DNA ligase
MENFALKWKNEVNFNQVTYEDFVTLFDDIKNIMFLEKIDGMLGMLIYNKKDIFFQTTTGREIRDLPVLSEYKALFSNIGLDEAIIAGELVGQKNGVIFPFPMTQSVVKTSYAEKNKDLIYHYPYDIYSLNNTKPGFKGAYSFLLRHTKALSHIRVPLSITGDMSRFRMFFLNIQNKQGTDGVVARDIKGRNYKIKFFNTADVVIIGGGNKNMKAWTKNQIPYLLTAFIDKDGNFRETSKVGTGFTFEEREMFFKYITQNEISVRGDEILVKPTLVIEVKFFRSFQPSGRVYSFKGGSYEFIHNDKTITFSNPSFMRLRPDKKANKIDVRMEQLPTWKY